MDDLQTEMIEKTLAQQLAKIQTYKILKAQGLPIPEDLRREFENG